ncbi:MAG: hypothetical protein HRT45_14640 [Bdellovibrionales bacterium]|nr:hypothetical protein [Bdellovibrionales bacterium]
MQALSSFEEQTDFGPEGLQSWRTILTNHAKTRDQQVYKLFRQGLEVLEVSGERIPSLEEVNARLFSLTGWRGVFVEGLEDAYGFYKLLANRQFPIGNFIRDNKDLSYTPEPDIVHDLYGHIPFLVNSDYANFCYRFANLATQYMDREDLLRQFERFFWFTVEFGLIHTPDGVRVFGAGIASSAGEYDYALSGQPEVIDFDVDKIRKQEFRIDEMQKRLFVLKNVEQLYGCLDELQAQVELDR